MPFGYFPAVAKGGVIGYVLPKVSKTNTVLRMAACYRLLITQVQKCNCWDLVIDLYLRILPFSNLPYVYASSPRFYPSRQPLSMTNTSDGNATLTTLFMYPFISMGVELVLGVDVLQLGTAMIAICGLPLVVDRLLPQHADRRKNLDRQPESLPGQETRATQAMETPKALLFGAIAGVAAALVGTRNGSNLVFLAAWVRTLGGSGRGFGV